MNFSVHFRFWVFWAIMILKYGYELNFWRQFIGRIWVKSCANIRNDEHIIMLKETTGSSRFKHIIYSQTCSNTFQMVKPTCLKQIYVYVYVIDWHFILVGARPICWAPGELGRKVGQTEHSPGANLATHYQLQVVAVANPFILKCHAEKATPNRCFRLKNDTAYGLLAVRLVVCETLGATKLMTS